MYGRGPSSMGGMTPIVQRLMIANAGIWIASMLLPAIEEFGAIRLLSPPGTQPAGFFQGLLWQPFTYMWLHAGAFHLFMNMFVLWMFGNTMESLWGSQRFLRFYLICGVGAGFVILFWNAVTGTWYTPTVGASGAIYGLLMAFSLTWPDRTIMLLFPPMPMKAIWMIPVLFVLTVAMGGGNISHAGHLGGVLVAMFLMRQEVRTYFNFSSVRFKWHRWRMRRRLRAVRNDDRERRKRARDDDQPPTIH